MNKKLMLVAKACLLSLLASSGSAPAAAAAGAGAGVRGKAADYKSERENKEPYSFKVGKGTTLLAYSPDGNRLAIANQDTDEVRVFNVDRSTGALQEIGGSLFSVKNPSSIVYSPDGKWLAVTTGLGIESPTVHNLTVFKVDETTGALRSIAGSPFKTDTVAIKARYSPDGNWLAVAQLKKNSLTILKVDNATGQLQKVKGSPFKIDSLGGWVWAVAYSPDGNWLASAGNGCSERPNSLTMFKVNKNTGALEKVEGSPFDCVCSNIYSLVFSPDGKRLAMGGDVLTVLNVDERSGVLRQVNGAPFFKPNKGWFNSIIYSPDGSWLAAVCREKDSLMVFKVDKVTGQLKKVHGSPFNTGSSPSSIAYSPDGSCLALADEEDGVVWIYEVDQETGALSPITGGILTHIKKRYQEAERVLTNKESMSESVMPKDVLGVLHEYIVGPRAKPSNDLPKTQKEVMQGDIDLARKQQKESATQIPKLFAAIKEGSVSEIDRLLTPFTINARDNEYNTPLIMAASHQRDAIVQKILAYEGKIQRDEYHADIVRADLKAINSAKNSALKLALVHNNYAIAHMIVQEMFDRHIKDKKEPYLSVDERNEALAMVLMAVDQNNVDVIRLIELLQKD